MAECGLRSGVPLSEIGLRVVSSLLADAARHAFAETAESERAQCLIDPMIDARWDRLVAQHPRASVFHSRGWLKALSEAYGYRPIVVTSSAHGEPLRDGIVFAKVNSWITGRRWVSLPFSDHCEPLHSEGEDPRPVVEFLRTQMVKEKSKYFEIRPALWRPDPSLGLSSCMSYQLHRLDLTGSLQKLYGRLHKDCVQRKIRRSEKEKLRYEEGMSSSLVRQFYDLLVMTRRRHHVPPQPLHWFETLGRTMGDAAKIRIASKGDVPIAAILTLSHKKTVTYKYGCSNAAYHNLGGVAFLLWRVIEEAHHAGCEEFDLGRCETANQGQRNFKEHWGSRVSNLNYWTSTPQPNLQDPGTWENRFRRMVVALSPNAALKMAGRLCYRHIG